MAKAVSPEERKRELFERVMASVKAGEFHGEEKDKIILEIVKDRLGTLMLDIETTAKTERNST